MTKNKTITVATRVTATMYQEIIDILGRKHLNIADYIRDLIRRDLEEKRRK